MKQTKVNVHSGYEVDKENLATPVFKRTQEFLSRFPTKSIYLNPICTIVADEPSQNFFETVKKWQAKWCKEASTFIGRDTRRSVRNYISDKGRTSKKQRFFERAFSFTGILFVNNELIQSNRWKEFKADDVNPKPTSDDS